MLNFVTECKPLFWESETNLETFYKIFLHIGVSYKFVLKCCKSLNRIIWPIEFWYKAQKSALKLSSELLPILEFPINLFPNLNPNPKPKSSLRSDQILVQDSKMKRFFNEFKPFFWESKASLEIFQKPSLYWSFL